MALFAVIFVPYFVWRYDYYDWFFPNTYYAKVGDGFDQLDRGVKYILAFLQESGGWLLLLLPLAIAESAVRRTAAAYVLALTGVWFAYTAYVGGDSLLRYRFLAPVLPLYYSVMAVTAVAVATRLRSALPRQPLRGRGHRFGSPSSPRSPSRCTRRPSMPITPAASGSRSSTASHVGRWLRDNLPD